MVDLKTFIIELLFPRTCFGCTAFGTYLCDTCESKIRVYSTSEAIFQTTRPPRQKIFVATNYNDTVIQQLLHGFKYRFVRELGETLGSVLSTFITQSFAQLPVFDIVVPVPLSTRRLRWRDFNQSELLARVICRQFCRPLVTDALIRSRYARPQVGLRIAMRQQNVRGVFQVINAPLIAGKNILLIDDVVTTGSTCNEAAVTLLKAGAGSVWSLAVAQG